MAERRIYLSSAIVGAVRTLFSSRERLLGQLGTNASSYDDTVKRKCVIVSRVSALWVVLWGILIPAVPLIVLWTHWTRAAQQISPLTTCGWLVLSIPIYYGFVVVAMLLQACFLKPFLCLCNRILGVPNVPDG